MIDFDNRLVSHSTSKNASHRFHLVKYEDLFSVSETVKNARHNLPEPKLTSSKERSRNGRKFTLVS